MILFREQYLKAVKENAKKCGYRDPYINKEFTYEEFDIYVRRIAAKLAKSGLQKGDTCAIAMAHNVHYIAAMYACLMSGICYVPLSDAYPRDRIDMIYEDAEAKLLLKDDFMDDVESMEPVQDFPEVLDTDLAAITYTSGSTGRPKGVMHNFAGFTNAPDIYREMLEFEKDDIYATNAPFYFVVHFMDVYSAFLHGTTTVLVPDHLRGDPKGLAEFYDQEKVTMSLIVPKVLRYFEKKGDSLRRVVTAGERVANTFKDDFEIVNGYGTSEVVCCVLGYKIDRAYDNTPIGYPVGPRGIYILDANGNIADEGELCVSGYNAIGYKNLPELTEKTFVDNPFYEDDGHEKLVHTGDLVKRLPSGAILYVNRKDWMIKINGQRVEPGEIEAAVAKVDGILENCVKAFDRPDGQTVLTAFYVSKDAGEIDKERFTSELAKTLPSYMIPAYYVRLDKMPTNANGKLDRKSLAAPAFTDYTSPYAAPETKEQEIVCEAFAKILGMEKAGIDDDFFSLGGDSIKTLVLQNSLDEYGITKADIFAAHTPRELAERMKKDKSGVISLAEYMKTYEDKKDTYPLTESQLAVYLDSFDPDRATTYNNLMGLFLPNEGNPEDAYERLLEAAKKVVNSYPILKCHVEEIDGTPSFVYDDSVTVEVQTIETEETDTEKLAHDLIRPFDLGRAPLARAALFRTPEGLFLGIDTHHVLCDGTSVSLMIDNISRAYEGRELRTEKVTNLALASFEQECLGETKKADNDFYRNMLDGMDGELEVYADDEPSIADMKGRLVTSEKLLLSLDENIQPQLSDALKRFGVTEGSVFAGAYAYTLKLLSGQKKVLLFAGENGRDDPLLTDTFGMMVHNIPMLFDIEEEKESRDYLKYVQSRVFECVSHDSADISSLMSEYHIHPEYTFVYQGDMLSGTTMDGRYIPLELYRADDAMNRLTLHVLKQPGEDYMLRFEYDAGVYTADTIDRIARLFARIVAGLIKDQKLCEIQLLAAEDIAEQEANNATERKYEIADIVTLFKKAAAKYPDNNAVFYKGRMLSYREVDEISDRIAASLRSRGVGAGKVVSILISRSSYMVTASLGVLKTGAAYQPLDPSYPVERLTFMMQDADAACLIADEELLPRVPEYRGEVLLTRDIPNLPEGRVPDGAMSSPDSLFILLYTSGSTGTPKGVKLLHRNIANFCSWYREFYELDPASRVAAYASYGFDADMMDLYPALTTGACVYIIHEEIRLDLLALESYFNENAISHSFMTTQVGRQFYSMASPATLRFLSTGGEKLVPLSPVESAPPFYNVYGPTECTILATSKLMDRLYDRVPIGRPIANYKVYVADSYGRQLPALIPGELLISGAGVAEGYLNRPELTEKAFIKNPFTDEPGYERAYRSGDVVRLLKNGEVDFIGRNDGQVKVRGFRIELTEVEGIIREFKGIKDATVQAFEDEASGEKYIAAYIVSDDKIDVSALNDFIRSEKPPYMVPAVTMQLDAIPLNQNQKVNKRALPKPERAHEELVMPSNDMQQKIYDCVADVLGHKDFGVTTQLQDAGLSSIGSIKLNALLSKTFDLVFTTRDLKEQSTIVKLESFILAKQGGGVHEADLSLRPDYPLSKTQEGVYVECVASPSTCKYNIPILLEIDTALDEGRLKSAIVSAVNAHPFIKTRLFLNDDGDIRMRRMDADLSFTEESVEIISADSIDAVKDSLVQPFNLIGGRLYRIKLINTGDGKRYLFLEMHHLISDGTSMGIFLNDISKAYAGEEPETEKYSGYEAVLNEEHERTAKRLEEIKSYYEKLLDEAETQSLPTGDIADGTRTKDGTGAPGVLETDGEAVTVSEIKDFCNKNGLSLNAMFSACFGHLLNAYLNTESSVFAGIYNGRSDSRLLNTVAMLVKTIPIAGRAKPGETVKEHVKAMGAQLSDTQAADLYSFGEVCRQFGVNADVMFAYQGDDFAFDSLCGSRAELVPMNLDAVKAPLNVMVFLTGDKVHYSIEYNADRFSPDYIRSMIKSMDQGLKEMMTKERMADISFVTDEMAAELESFNDTKAAVEPAFAPDRMREACEKYADRIAVIACGGSRKITFAELNSRANKIANTLLEKGIGRGVRVGLYMERNEDVYAIRQGIMKTGAAFVNLEPDYPDDRIAFILKDAGISVLITTTELHAKRATLFDSAVSVMELSDIYEGSAPDTEPKRKRIREDDPAYCIYTSGSTGNPKGVEISHKNLRNLLDLNDRNTLAHAYVDNSTVWLALAAITFDVSIIEEMMPIYHGRTVVMASEDEVHNPMLLVETMRKTGVDMMKCTPSYMLSILEVQAASEVFKQLKAVILGAEPFPKGMYEKLRNAGFDGIVFNSYGPTETCVSVSIGELDGRYVTIGGPNANTGFLIRDRFGNILPKYMRGELVITGDCVGKGYVGLPEKTREVFITDSDGRRMYRSGDIAYFNHKGEIMHCGRNDNQIKIRGLRVELDGIENTMNTFPGIERSVVMVLGEGDGKYLAGYYVARHPVNEEELSAHLKKTLTSYMVPAVYVYLEELPLTVNGKVNKKALPRPEAKKKESKGRSASTPLQKEIAEMFAKALGIESIGIDEDFFEMGGTSMLASKIAMAAMVKDMPIAYQDVFNYPTVAAMEEHVLEASGGEHEEAEEKKETVETPVQDGSVDAVLAGNSLKYIDGIRDGYREDLGTVLLTGATGFLGIHVLGYLLEHTSSKIICLIRKGNAESVDKRMKTMLMYYFDKPYNEAFEAERVLTLDGDITDRDKVLALNKVPFDTVINCAACVKHFANDDILERVNVTGVKNLMTLCEETGRRLVQISTVSVAGENVDHALPSHLVMNETMLFFGQDLSNQYVRSKFEAERAMLNDIAKGKLDGKIIRVGNLMSRESDSEFQANSITSGFMRSLRGYVTIGAYPESEMARPVEFSPIDVTAEAVVRLAGTPSRYTVFHAVNGHWIEMGDLIAAVNEAGLKVDMVSDREFQKRLKEALSDEKKNMLVSGLISYLSSDADSVRSYVGEDHAFTKNVLYRLGFRWPLTDEKYLTGAIEALITMGFFDEEE